MLLGPAHLPSQAWRAYKDTKQQLTVHYTTAMSPLAGYEADKSVGAKYMKRFHALDVEGKAWAFSADK